ncbi:MAG TPA: TadE family protein [Chloroflexota bacterium]|nr:TadE family protein [Chloroflexota bacterium]
MIEPTMHQPRRSRDRGQALVELALILPILLFLTMGAIQVAALGMVWISLQGLTQDTARWMAISSQAPPPLSNCTDGTSLWPRPRWADGNDGAYYMNCHASGLLRGTSFSSFATLTWSPACGNGTDCFAAGLRRADDMLTLTVTYNWSNVVFMPGGLSGWLGWIVPSTVTVSASEVMQY